MQVVEPGHGLFQAGARVGLVGGLVGQQHGDVVLGFVAATLEPVELAGHLCERPQRHLGQGLALRVQPARMPTSFAHDRQHVAQPRLAGQPRQHERRQFEHVIARAVAGRERQRRSGADVRQRVDFAAVIRQQFHGPRTHRLVGSPS